MTPAGLTALDATELAARVRAQTISARHLVDVTLTQIEHLEPTINAFRIVMTEHALADADRIDALPDDERAALPLAGVPVAIKDDTDVAGQSTMWGSAVDRGVSAGDAEVVTRLRRAGAVIIGKTNVPELTLWPWTSSQAWGTTLNPWDLDRTPGGSSGGSAAAVCSGMAAIALGSDGGGSIRYPAGLTGLVGLKPQRDRVPIGSEHGSGWNGLIALGSLTRSVRDAALFLDAVHADATASGFRDAVQAPRQTLRVAVSMNAPPGSNVSLSSARRQQVEAVASVLADFGHTVTRVDLDYGLASLWQSTLRLLDGANQDAASMPDQRALERRTRSVARMGGLIPRRSVRKAIGNEHRSATSINRAFDNADVILTPLCAASAPAIEDCPASGAGRSLRASNTSAWLVPWNLIGQPALTVPTGIGDDNLPTAVHLAGRAGDEATLLAVAAHIEAAFRMQQWIPSA